MISDNVSHQLLSLDMILSHFTHSQSTAYLILSSHPSFFKWVKLIVLTGHANNFKYVATLMNIDTVVHLIWFGKSRKVLGQAVLPKQNTAGQITRFWGVHTCPTQTVISVKNNASTSSMFKEHNEQISYNWNDIMFHQYQMLQLCINKLKWQQH